MTIAKRHFRGALLALALVAMPAAGLAEHPATPKTKSAPKSVPTLDAEALKIPDSIHETHARKIEKPVKTLPPPALPNKFDLGAYDLEFKASSSKDVVPRTGFDSGEKSNLSNTAFGRKSDPALPNYFGLKLSAPVR